MQPKYEWVGETLMPVEPERPKVHYMDLTIGKATVVMCYTAVDNKEELLCVKRSHADSRKLKLKRRWWHEAETRLTRALSVKIN